MLPPVLTLGVRLQFVTSAEHTLTICCRLLSVLLQSPKIFGNASFLQSAPQAQHMPTNYSRIPSSLKKIIISLLVTVTRQ
jgi:hypothetical protein